MLPPNDLSIFGQFADALENSWRAKARAEQIEPAGDWSIWLLLAGRGFGKTRTGAEWVLEQIAAGKKRIALVAPTAADARDVMVEGESGILACSPEWNRPVYEPSKRRLTWPNGAQAATYSADEPERLRGPQHDAGWCDELAAWRFPEAWDMLQFGLRLGSRPRCIVTTTPKPTKLIRDLIARHGRDVAITRGRTADNAANLAPSFLLTVERQYGGTRLGRQELEGLLLTDTPGALWTREMIERARVRFVDLPEMRRIVVAIDPAATSGEDADESGIIVAGLGQDGKGYVLEDRSGRYTPTEWAREAVAAYYRRGADRIVAEVNNGGEMCEACIRVIDPSVSFKAVHASRGKIARAEPVSALYEQNRVFHVGAFPALEDQMCEFSPGGMAGGGSPDHMDALVWALTELMVGAPDGLENFLGFMRLEIAAQGRGGLIDGQAGAPTRLRAPEGLSTVYLRSGQCLAIPADRIIEVAEEDALPLLGAGAGFTKEESQ
jgi:phage terminase large subunit-like protein